MCVWWGEERRAEFVVCVLLLSLRTSVASPLAQPSAILCMPCLRTVYTPPFLVSCAVPASLSAALPPPPPSSSPLSNHHNPASLSHQSTTTHNPITNQLTTQTQPGERFRSFDPARQERFINRLVDLLADKRCTQVLG